MPPVSERQRRAMFAAKSGKSTIGIPKSVGEEFTAADQGGALPSVAPKNAAKPQHAQRKKGQGRSLNSMFAPKSKG